MSGKQPTTYVGTAFIIGVVLIVALVLFLRHQWGGH